jgi:hypothetical protein
MSVPPRAGVTSPASLVNPIKEVQQITHVSTRNCLVVIDYTSVSDYGL